MFLQWAIQRSFDGQTLAKGFVELLHLDPKSNSVSLTVRRIGIITTDDSSPTVIYGILYYSVFYLIGYFGKMKWQLE